MFVIYHTHYAHKEFMIMTISVKFLSVWWSD
jgi:hypothetical protein